MGKPVVSTPYWHAAELLADGRGVLVPFADPAAIAAGVLGLLDDPAGMHAMREAAYRLGREFVWPRVGERYLEVFRDARQGAGGGRARRQARCRPTRLPRPPGERFNELPALRLDHLRRLLDSTGIAQHAVHAVVDRAHGYCLDDNARGLMLATLLRAERCDAAERCWRRSCSPAPRRSCCTRGTARPGAFATSWATTAAGWRRRARRTATAAPCGRSGPSSGAPDEPAPRLGRRPSGAVGRGGPGLHLAARLGLRAAGRGRLPGAAAGGPALPRPARAPGRPAARPPARQPGRGLDLVRGRAGLRQRAAAAGTRRGRPAGGNARTGRTKALEALRLAVRRADDRRRVTSARSARTASGAAAASGRSSTSSRWKPAPRSAPASRRGAPRATCAGWARRGGPSTGSSASTTWASRSTIRQPAVAGTACSAIG